MRAVLAAILVFEAIVVGLAIPVAISLGGVGTGAAATTGAVVAAGCLITAGLVRHRAGIVIGSLLQVVTFALGIVVPVMYILGVVFGALWVWSLVLDRKIKRGAGATTPPPADSA